MSLLLKETEANFDTFGGDWRKHMADVSAELTKQRPKYLESYRRIVSLQAWRSFLESRVSDASLSFFLEAQNDALTSHVFASLGSWRSSLKALRSGIENVMFSLYYKDHPVEFTLWEAGHHKPPISDFVSYLERHPLRIKEATVDPIPHIQAEYATLSKAVHASARNFRMTKDIKTTLLWSSALPTLGQWQAREAAVLLNLNLLLLVHFRNDLTGAAGAPLREAVSLAIAPSKYSDIKTHLGVALRQP
jgi:hypothetical protein